MDLKLAFDRYQHDHELESAAYWGMTRLSSEQKIEAILARADSALARAQTEVVNGWAIQQNDEVVEVQGQRHWTQALTDLLEQESISFTCQPIQPGHRGMLAYHEIYPRFSSSDGTVLPSDTLLAMAQRLDMVLRLTQMVIAMSSANTAPSEATTADGSNRRVPCCKTAPFSSGWITSCKKTPTSGPTWCSSSTRSTWSAT